MGFSITGGHGPLSIIIIALLNGAGFIVVTWFLAAVRQDRRAVLDEEDDRTGYDV